MGTVTSAYVLDYTMRYVVDFGRVEAVLYGDDIEGVSPDAGPVGRDGPPDRS